MRRASTCLALLGLIAVAAAPAASAEIPTPTIKFKTKAVPIPGFPGTGNFYGKGADLEAEYEIEGTGYAPTEKNPNGGIPPISKVNFYLPKGTVLNKSGWGACSEAILKNSGASGCPPHSAASPQGHVLGEVTIGGEHVPEETSLEAFFGPSGSLLFFTRGTTPVSLEIVSTGTYKKSSGKYAWELETLVPPVPSLPGAPLASVKTIHIKAGAAYKKKGKVYSYGVLPKKGQCPKGGFPVKTEVFFGGEEGAERNFGFPVKERTAEFKAKGITFMTDMDLSTSAITAQGAQAQFDATQASLAGAAGSDPSTMLIGSEETFKAKYPELFNAFLQGIASWCCQQQQNANDRFSEAQRQSRE